MQERALNISEEPITKIASRRVDSQNAATLKARGKSIGKFPGTKHNFERRTISKR